MTGCMINGRTRYPDETVERAKALYAVGVPCRVIAQELGITSDVIVRRWCDEAYRLQYNERAKLKARCGR